MQRKQALPPSQRSAIAKYAARVRWNRVRAAKGQPVMPLPVLVLSTKPRAVFMRARRDLGRRRAAFDGVKYDDGMASDPIVYAEARRALPAAVREALEALEADARGYE